MIAEKPLICLYTHLLNQCHIVGPFEYPVPFVSAILCNPVMNIFAHKSLCHPSPLPPALFLYHFIGLILRKTGKREQNLKTLLIDSHKYFPERSQFLQLSACRRVRFTMIRVLLMCGEFNKRKSSGFPGRMLPELH